MKKKVVILIGFAMLIVLSSCARIFGVEMKIVWSETKYCNIGDRFYEESPDGYKAVYHSIDEMELPEVKQWLADSRALVGDVFHSFIYSDPDSWDMFVYYPKAGLDKLLYDMKFYVADGKAHLQITSNGKGEDSVPSTDDYLLIRIEAPLRGAWPTAATLTIDGDQKRLSQE